MRGKDILFKQGKDILFVTTNQPTFSIHRAQDDEIVQKLQSRVLRTAACLNMVTGRHGEYH